MRTPYGPVSVSAAVTLKKSQSMLWFLHNANHWSSETQGKRDLSSISRFILRMLCNHILEITRLLAF